MASSYGWAVVALAALTIFVLIWRAIRRGQNREVTLAKEVRDRLASEKARQIEAAIRTEQERIRGEPGPTIPEVK